MEKLKCLILNISPFGPQDEKGIGKNSIFQYIPLDKSKMTCKEKSLVYYVSFNCIYDTSETSLFNTFFIAPLLNYRRQNLGSCRQTGLFPWTP